MAVTLKQIADAAGVSRGTVDRVVNGRGHVKPEVAERIWQLAKDLNYSPNPLGRALVKSGRTTKIGVICQFSETPFMKLVVEGIDRARQELTARGTDLLLETIDSYDAGKMLRSIDKLLEEGVQGLALTPGNAPETLKKIREVTGQGIPVITFNTDAPDTGRLCYVGLENLQAGRTCAGLMASCLRQGGLVLPIAGYEGNPSHAQRLAGFRSAVQETYPALRLLPSQLCYDTDRVAAEVVHRTLREHPDLQGIYLSGNGQRGVCEALRQEGQEGRVCVIVYDLTQANIQELNRGAIDFLIDQNAFEQGYRPAMLLYDLLILNQKPDREFYLTDICIKTRYNL